MTESSADLDYADLYDGYWQRPENARHGNLPDPGPVAMQVLSGLGTGRLLDVGCGGGALVQSLLAHGVDAHGVDVAQVVVDRGNRIAPGRFHQGSVLDLPFADQHFHAVLATGCLEHLREQDVPRALAELHRVAKRGVFLRVSTAPDPDRGEEAAAAGHRRRTVQPRAWWEDRLFEAGFRKHPRAMAIVPYERLESDAAEITLLHERLAPETLRAHSIERLLETRYLHMDMLRETGRRSDAHVARYHLAADFVRPNDVVLDVACGLGYGSAVLAANSEAARIVGVDLDEYAVQYATATTSGSWPQVSFRAGDATDLSFLADRSVDLVTSFETLEHVPDPAALLAEFDRVLKPSGRVLVSVPHMWVDETGRDPNPHHLHVYDWAKLKAQLAACFVPEAVWGQTAGGGMKLTDAPRAIMRAELADPRATPAEWWLALAMKPVLDAGADDYEETSFPPMQGGERPNVTAFGRDYDNPWLVKALVVRGQRVCDDDVLREMAQQVLERSPIAGGSADAGAAACVLAYLLLADRGAEVARIDACLAQIDGYCQVAAANPNVLRWQVSLQFVAACLLRKCGRRAEAAARFRACAAIDVAPYSAILGTKTVDALLQAGLIAAADGDEAAARTDWQQALAATERLLQGDWAPFVGDRSRPLAFGLREATDLLDLTAQAARGLLDLDNMRLRPGKTWELLRFGLRPSISSLEHIVDDLRRWSQRLLGDVGLLRQEADQQQQQREQERAANEAVREQARREARQQLERLQRELAERSAELADARVTIASQEQLIANLQRMRGIKGTLRGLLDRIRGRS